MKPGANRRENAGKDRAYVYIHTSIYVTPLAAAAAAAAAVVV
jgi:hypothetical protein